MKCFNTNSYRKKNKVYLYTRKNEMGRPKKVGAIKSGELQDGYKRFSFIAKSEQIDELKRIIALNVTSGSGPQTIKAYMEKKLPYPNNNKGITKGSISIENERKMKEFIKKITPPKRKGL